MNGWFNGEREYYACMAVAAPVGTIPAPAPSPADLTPDEKDMCRRMGIDEQNFARVRADTIARLKELEQ